MASPADSSVFSRAPRWAWVCAGFLLALALLMVLWDWNWFKGPIERKVTAATGRAFAIRGDLDVDLGLHPRITAEDVHFANADWSKVDPEMFSARRIDLRVTFWPLLSGRLELPYVALDQPRILFERNESKQSNWRFESKLPKLKKKQRTPLPDVNQLLVKDGELRLHEASFETDVRLRLNSGAPTAESPHAPLNAKGEGSWRGYPFDLEGRVDSPLDLQNQERPYHADVRARAGRTQAHASGALRGQLQPENFDIEFDISGNTLGDLYRQTGIALPDSAPYRLNGRLNRQGDVWSYRKFTGKVGSSDIAGNVSVDLGTERRMLKGVLTSKRLAFRDLSGFINVPPGASDEDIEAAKALKLAKPTVLPDRPFKLEKLRSIDADVSFEATHIDAPKLPLERMKAHLVL
ncbi:MAG: AsmA family protein, partial [Povalibacter sp.]